MIIEISPVMKQEKSDKKETLPDLEGAKCFLSKNMKIQSLHYVIGKKMKCHFYSSEKHWTKY